MGEAALGEVLASLGAAPGAGSSRFFTMAQNGCVAQGALDGGWIWPEPCGDLRTWVAILA